MSKRKTKGIKVENPTLWIYPNGDVWVLLSDDRLHPLSKRIVKGKR